MPFDRGSPTTESCEDPLTLRRTHRTAIVRPDRVTVIPAYLLRWLPVLGHTRAWMLVAFHQAFFLAKGHKAQPGVPFSASAQTLARWSGLSRRAVVEQLNKLASPNNPLGCFIERVCLSASQSARYRFRARVLLTPGDRRHLERLLVTAGIRENPIKALHSLLALPPDSLLPPILGETQKGEADVDSDNSPEEPGVSPAPCSLQQLLLEIADPALFGRIEFSRLSSELTERIWPPQDVLLISHYFLRHWLPRLGSGPAWLITLLRRAGYWNRQTGEVRKTVTLQGGCKSLTAALGLRRAHTVESWLPTLAGDAGLPAPSAPRWAAARGDVARFIRKTGCRRDPWNLRETTWELQIEMEDPLLPEHEETRAEQRDGACQGNPERVVTTSGQRSSINFPVEARDLHTSGEQPGKDKKERARDLHTSSRSFHPIGQCEARDLRTPADQQLAKCTSAARDLHTPADQQVAKCTSAARDLHTLKDLNQDLNQKRLLNQRTLTTTTASTPLEPDDPAVVGTSSLTQDEGDFFQADSSGYLGSEISQADQHWDFSRLLALGGIDLTRRRALCSSITRTPAIGQQLLAWLLYAFENRKTRERRTGIESPFAFAISRADQPPPGTTHFKLAALGPNGLLDLLRRVPYDLWGLPDPEKDRLTALVDHGFRQLLDELCHLRPASDSEMLDIIPPP